MIVDVHAHALSERFLTDLQRRPIADISAERGDNGTYFMRGGGWDRPSPLDVNLHDVSGGGKRFPLAPSLFSNTPGPVVRPASQPSALRV